MEKRSLFFIQIFLNRKSPRGRITKSNIPNNLISGASRLRTFLLKKNKFMSGWNHEHHTSQHNSICIHPNYLDYFSCNPCNQITVRYEILVKENTLEQSIRPWESNWECPNLLNSFFLSRISKIRSIFLLIIGWGYSGGPQTKSNRIVISACRSPMYWG